MFIISFNTLYTRSTHIFSPGDAVPFDFTTSGTPASIHIDGVDRTKVNIETAGFYHVQYTLSTVTMFDSPPPPALAPKIDDFFHMYRIELTDSTGTYVIPESSAVNQALRGPLSFKFSQLTNSFILRVVRNHSYIQLRTTSGGQISNAISFNFTNPVSAAVLTLSKV
ncbi:hypothetical protein IC620_14585 [Hazenella sp. IB182357]|uniref:Uncharacterized protein n=1 Tax=Polycladospora coralii TaxID=2771432 RepID=A0A926NC67_9BACL|nr:hypothetical protein [Polycladospora coralii]MBD1373572.1 hypothetical protein [Polycladospora coralii]MBS7531945.1 hypothetical protein [Polycladospora coralii]